jgi:hypothetical protein
MASIERTAYPRFRRVVSARELADLTPTADDVAWARARSRTDEHLLALVLSLRCFGRLGYFARSEDVPDAVVDHVRRCLELEDWTAAVCGTSTAKLHRTLVRERLGVTCDPARARAVCEDAIGGAASRPGSVTTSTARCSSASARGWRCPTGSPSHRARRRRAGVQERVSQAQAGGGPRVVVGVSRAGPHLRWVDSLGDTDAWLDGIAESKIADFAGEAMAADAGVMSDVAPAKRTALLACMVHVARTRARDDLAEMFCKRMASITKLAKARAG